MRIHIQVRQIDTVSVLAVFFASHPDRDSDFSGKGMDTAHSSRSQVPTTIVPVEEEEEEACIRASQCAVKYASVTAVGSRGWVRIPFRGLDRLQLR